MTDRLDNAFTRVELPTIFDRLAAKNVAAGYYCGNTNFLLLWNQIYNPITRTHARFFADCKRGTLPAFSFVDPNYTFDEWGGFFDHVPPPVAPDVDVRFQQRGFRVPTLLISPLCAPEHRGARRE